MVRSGCRARPCWIAKAKAVLSCCTSAWTNSRRAASDALVYASMKAGLLVTSTALGMIKVRAPSLYNRSMMPVMLDMELLMPLFQALRSLVCKMKLKKQSLLTDQTTNREVEASAGAEN